MPGAQYLRPVILPVKLDIIQVIIIIITRAFGLFGTKRCLQASLMGWRWWYRCAAHPVPGAYGTNAILQPHRTHTESKYNWYMRTITTL